MAAHSSNLTITTKSKCLDQEQDPDNHLSKGRLKYIDLCSNYQAQYDPASENPGKVFLQISVMKGTTSEAKSPDVPAVMATLR